MGRAPYIIALTAIIFCTSCKTEDEKIADTQYEIFIAKTVDDSLSVTAESSAEFVAKFHYDGNKRRRAEEWLTAFKKKMDGIHEEIEAEREKVKRKIDNLGGYSVIKIDTKTKCNLFTGSYLITKTINDSADLAFLAKYLADQLFQNSKKDPGCSFPVMSQALIYRSWKDYKENEGGWISMCSITPHNYDGEVSVNTLLLKRNKSK